MPRGKIPADDDQSNRLLPMLQAGSRYMKQRFLAAQLFLFTSAKSINLILNNVEVFTVFFGLFSKAGY